MTLEQLGWNVQLAAHLAAAAPPGHVPARVAREDRESYVVYAESRAWRASVSGALRHRARGRTDFPAVGDWVAVQPRGADAPATIHALLPRRTAVVRRAAGAGVEGQVIAANVDRLLICCGLDQDFNLRRIERYLTLAHQSGAAPVVLLSKADLCAAAGDRLAQVEAVAVGAPVLAISVVSGVGLDQVAALIPAGLTAALVGSSGVGKSTLINALLGARAMATQAVRAADGRGRHTTTHRQLLPLPGGGVIIDTPGMRELSLWGSDEDVDATFADLQALAGGCRFRDCTHESEPGCAVRSAVAAGEFDAGRLKSYRKQQSELRWLASQEDPLLRIEIRDKWKRIHKSARRHLRKKYGE